MYLNRWNPNESEKISIVQSKLGLPKYFGDEYNKELEMFDSVKYFYPEVIGERKILRFQFEFLARELLFIVTLSTPKD